VLLGGLGLGLVLGRGGGGSLLLDLFLSQLGQLKDDHGGAIAHAGLRELDDAGVAAIATSETRADFVEQALDQLVVAENLVGLTAGGEVVLEGQSNEAVHDAAQFLGLGLGGANGLEGEHGAGHVLEHSTAMGAVAVELAPGLVMPHFFLSS